MRCLQRVDQRRDIGQALLPPERDLGADEQFLRPEVQGLHVDERLDVVAPR